MEKDAFRESAGDAEEIAAVMVFTQSPPLTAIQLTESSLFVVEYAGFLNATKPSLCLPRAVSSLAVVCFWQVAVD
jgi:hypothetical protein